MIQGEVNEVANTNILVSTIKDAHELQLTIYSNKVELENTNNSNPVAMILPFPNFSGKSNIRVLETRPADEKIFKTLEGMFESELQVLSYGYLGAIPNSARSLKVHRSGSYRYSIVSHIDDFDRLDNKVFELYDQNLSKLLKMHYKDFGFIVCIMDKSAEYSPFMYVSPKLPDYKYFIPTRHYHGELKNQEHWDHRVYVLGTSDIMDNIPLTPRVLNESSTFNVDKLHNIKNIIDLGGLPSKCLRIKGLQTNCDIFVKS